MNLLTQKVKLLKIWELMSTGTVSTLTCSNSRRTLSDGLSRKEEQRYLLNVDYEKH